MPAPSDQCVTMLIKATAAEEASTGAGATFLNGIRDAAMAAVTNNGLIMASASTASKSFSFIEGMKLEKVLRDFREAWAIWNTYDEDQIAALTTTPPLKTTLARF